MALEKKLAAWKFQTRVLKAVLALASVHWYALNSLDRERSTIDVVEVRTESAQEELQSSGWTATLTWHLYCCK